MLVTCISIGSYDHALRYGDVYEVLEHDQEKKQYRLVGYNGRKRWFWCGLFREGRHELPFFESYYVPPYCDYGDEWEVNIYFTDGILRWFRLATPEYVTRMVSHKPFFLSPDPLMIVVPRLESADLDSILKELQDQGELFKCTMALEPEPEEP